MKALVCEMCASHDLVKENGMYICQHCGTKYTTEEAKKLMVDITGSTVKIDISEKLSNLYSIARRAKENNDSEKAAEYYDSILREDPTSWEATFYVTYFSAMETKIAYIATAANKVENVLKSTLELLKENETDTSNQESAATEIATNTLLIGSMFMSSATKHYNDFTFDDAKASQEHLSEYNSRRLAVINLYIALGDNLSIYLGDNKTIQSLCITAWKKAISELNNLNLPEADELAMVYEDKIVAYDPTYKREFYSQRIKTLRRLIENEAKPKANGCFGFGLGFGIPMIIFGIVMINSILWLGIICIILGAVVGIAGVSQGPYIKKDENEVAAKIKKYETEIARLEKELNS